MKYLIGKRLRLLILAFTLSILLIHRSSYPSIGTDFLTTRSQTERTRMVESPKMFIYFINLYTYSIAPKSEYLPITCDKNVKYLEIIIKNRAQ
ncbi:hypothetical protein J2Y67_000867 [Neobacillus niacini]|nr:hypothetical protein [Neobacillus niacini]